MPETLFITLTVISGVSWMIVYFDLIRRGFLDKTYGMPLFALALNLSWEFVFGFFQADVVGIQKVVNIIWFFMDVVIAYTYFKFGRQDFPQEKGKYFIPWSLTAFAVGFALIFTATLEFQAPWASIYTAFTQNLLMSILFIDMLRRRDNLDGQSMYIAIFKWIGTVAPGIQLFVYSGSYFGLALSVGIFVFDVIYIGLLYQKFNELDLNPFTREPIGKR